MLEDIREKKNNRLAYALLAISGFGMLFIGFPRFHSADYSALTIDGESISREAYQNQRAELQRQYPDLTDAQLRQSALERLMAQALLRQHAVQSGYVLSDVALYETIKNEFGDEKNYTETLNRMRTNAKSYEAGLRVDGGIQNYYTALQSALNAPQNQALSEKQIQAVMQARVYHRYQINLDQIAKSIEADESALQAYYQEHQAKYLSPETVSVKLLTFSAKDLTVDVAADAAELKKQSALAGKRRAEYIIFNKIEPANEAQSALKAGTVDFATLRAQVKDKTIDGEEGDFPLQGFGGTGLPVVDEALFALEKVGDVSDVLVTDYGRMLVKVLEIQEPSSDDLANKMKAEAQEKRYHEEGEKLVERALNGANIEEIAGLAKMEVQTLQGLTSDSELAWLKEAAAQSALFGDKAVSVGKMVEPFSLDDGLTTVFVQIEQRDLPTQLDFAAAQEQVKRDYVADKSRELAADKVKTIESALNEGKTPEAIAETLGVSFEKVELSRANAPTEVADLLFFSRGLQKIMQQEHDSEQGRVLSVYELKGFVEGELGADALALAGSMGAQVLRANQIAMMNQLQGQFVMEKLKRAKVKVNVEEASEGQ